MLNHFEVYKVILSCMRQQIYLLAICDKAILLTLPTENPGLTS